MSRRSKRSDAPSKPSASPPVEPCSTVAGTITLPLPTPRQKCLLGAAIAAEVFWISALIVLACV